MNEAMQSGVATTATGVMMPAMTSEEVALGITSRGKKMVPVAAPEGVMVRDFASVISGAYLAYMQKGGEVPDVNEVAAISGIDSNTVGPIMGTKEFQGAMLIRGVDMRGFSGLTPEQDMAIAIMSSPDGQPFSKKLKQAGVAPSVWRAWLKNPKFRAVWNRVAGDTLRDYEGAMMVALADKGMEGDVNAIKYAFEVSGRHNPQQQRAVDAEGLMTQLIEIIQDEVKDTEVLQRIASRMALAAGTQPNTKVIEG